MVSVLPQDCRQSHGSNAELCLAAGGRRRSGHRAPPRTALAWSWRWGLVWGWSLATSPTSWAWPHFQRVLAPYGACFICSAATWEGGQCFIVWQRRWDAGTGICPCPVGSLPEPGAPHLVRAAGRCPHPSRQRGFPGESLPEIHPPTWSRSRSSTACAGASRCGARPTLHGTLPVGGKRGSAAPDSLHRQQSCDRDAGLAQHQKVTACSTHPGLREQALSPHARGLEEPLSRAHLLVLLRDTPNLIPPPRLPPPLSPGSAFSLPSLAQGSARPTELWDGEEGEKGC